MPMYNPYPYPAVPTYQPQYQPPMQDRLAQLQNQYQTTIPQAYPMPQMAQMQTVQPMHLSGQIVDSIDVVKAKDVDMSGAVTYYPQSNGAVIYTKQLQADGTSRIQIYKLAEENAPQEAPAQPMTMDGINALFGQLRTDVLNEINGIKNMLPALMPAVETPSPKTTRGGAKQ